MFGVSYFESSSRFHVYESLNHLLETTMFGADIQSLLIDSQIQRDAELYHRLYPILKEFILNSTFINKRFFK